MYTHTIKTNNGTYTFTADHEYDFEEIQTYLHNQGDTTYKFMSVDIAQA